MLRPPIDQDPRTDLHPCAADNRPNSANCLTASGTAQSRDFTEVRTARRSPASAVCRRRAGQAGIILLVLYLAAPRAEAAPDAWWTTQPIRLVQTNLRETDSSLDAEALIRQVEAFPANTLLFSVGGIVAHYPTRVPNHYPSSFLPAGRDLVAEVLQAAHRRGIRVIGRFDFSRARRELLQAHPEWFFRTADGRTVSDENDLHGTCINGGYYHRHALQVLAEALERYELDGLFFNWFGNLRTDYYGNDIGLCHCQECTSRFRHGWGREIPPAPDAAYRRFMFESSRQVAAKFRDLIKSNRPEALFMTYFPEHTDAIVSEADFYKWRPSPQWIYSASESVNRVLGTHPGKAVFSLVMPYLEMRYRFASVAGPALRALLYQNIAHGGFPAFVVLGTLDQPDETATEAVRPVFRWHAQHQDLLAGASNAGRIILYAAEDPEWSSNDTNYRGFYRLLSELHLPFRVTARVEDLSPDEVDLVVVPGGPAPPGIETYLSRGGRVLVVGTSHPGLGLPPATRRWTDTRSAYFRIEDHTLLPSLRQTWTLFWEGDFLELESLDRPILSLIPPGPPDKVSPLTQRTNIPGLVHRQIGEGQVIYLPWDLGDLYYRFGNDKHRWLVADLVTSLLGSGPQLATDAHPSVETTLLKRPDGKFLLHLVNLSGHNGTTFFDPIEMRDVVLSLKGGFSRAHAVNIGRDLMPDRTGRLVLPLLREHEVILLEP
jgi:hypothetical protein